MPLPRSLCWVRRELRLNDSAALAEASAGGRKTAVVFVWDDAILSQIRNPANRRVSFVHASLEQLDGKLKSMGSSLMVTRGDPVREIPRLATQLGVDTVCWSEDYEPAAIRRDARVRAALDSVRVEAHAVKDSVIFHSDELLSASGTPFRVYSPYARAWKARLESARDLPRYETTAEMFIAAADLPPDTAQPSLDSLGFDTVPLWLKPGEDAAVERLGRFSDKVAAYAVGRDFPAEESTSTLSVDFRFGTISIREAVRFAMRQSNPGAEKWLNELIWRDFYKHILSHFPHVVTSPFQQQYEGLQYPGTEADWERWKHAETGFPIVDAAIRCLNQTGYMHNRLRMVVASFLTKDLLLDYRRGESWFARELLDYDLSSNNGGWQWASSVGCDPQPYFRVFNPLLQSQKFDPRGEFIRKWLPELSELSDAAIHYPAAASTMELAAAGVELGKTYPQPCVNHSEQKQKAIALLESAKVSRSNAS